MSLLSIATDVSSETQGPQPATIAGNTEPDAQLLLRTINKVGIKLMQIYPWSVLWKQHEFTAIAGQDQTAKVPSDFDRFVPETFWSVDNQTLISGPVSPSEWGALRVSSVTNSRNIKFSWRSGLISTIPDIGAGVACEYQYVTKNWCTDSGGGTPQSVFAADDDVALLNEDLITNIAVAEWLKSEGLPYGEAQLYAQENLDRLTGNDQASENIAVVGDIYGQNTRHYSGEPDSGQGFATYW